MASRSAMRAVGRAVKDGTLPPVKTLKCVDCGAPAACYDHRNYDFPLDVEATCMKCNFKRGAAEGPMILKPLSLHTRLRMNKPKEIDHLKNANPPVSRALTSFPRSAGSPSRL